MKYLATLLLLVFMALQTPVGIEGIITENGELVEVNFSIPEYAITGQTTNGEYKTAFPGKLGEEIEIIFEKDGREYTQKVLLDGVMKLNIDLADNRADLQTIHKGVETYTTYVELDPVLTWNTRITYGNIEYELKDYPARIIPITHDGNAEIVVSSALVPSKTIQIKEDDRNVEESVVNVYFIIGLVVIIVAGWEIWRRNT
jgi:hypothetical protein